MIYMHFRGKVYLLLYFFTVTGMPPEMFQSRPFAPSLLYMRKGGFILKWLFEADGD